MAPSKKAKKKPTKKASPKKAANKVVKAKVAKAKPAKKTAAKKKTAPVKAKTAKPAPKKASKQKKVTMTKPAVKATKASKANSPKAKAWMKPLDDRLLVELAEIEQVSPGGIILVDSSVQPENIEGYVTAIGRGHQNKKGRIRPIELKVGDKVVFSKYAGDKISHNGVNFVIIRESEVLGFAAN